MNLAIREGYLVVAADVRNPTLKGRVWIMRLQARSTKYFRMLEYAASSTDFFCRISISMGLPERIKKILVPDPSS